MPSLYLLLPDCAQDSIPKAMKAEFAGPLHRFLSVPCEAEKLLILLELHHEKLLLFLVYILKVITILHKMEYKNRTPWKNPVQLLSV